MARPMGPRFKVARRLGVNVFNHPKALKRGVKTIKPSEYGKQLIEKQKLREYYGVLEKQFLRYVTNALKSKDNSGEFLITSLETRLDNMVYRLGFGSTLRQSRQMVVHGHILVNGSKVDRPSYNIVPGDVISLSHKSLRNTIFKDNFISTVNIPSYMEKNLDSFSGKLTRIPFKHEVPIEVKDSSVLEFYSRN